MYENFLVESLKKEMGKKSPQPEVDTINSKNLYKGFFNHIRLILWGFCKSTADINIVVWRLGLSSILRNYFNRKKTILVIHALEEGTRGRGKDQELYYKVLRFFLKRCRRNKVAIITVAPFYHKFFRRLFPNLNVYFFPNLFDRKKYEVKFPRDNKKVVMGQYSFKTDPSAFILAKELNQAEYRAFFCILSEIPEVHEDIEIRKLSFEKYIEELASAKCSLSLTVMKEAWNRMVHESILVGTPVIGYDRGGLGDLLRESNSYIVKDAEEAFQLITSQNLIYRTSESFIEKYDISKVPEYIAPIIEFILNED